ncbi:hypothetical protein L21SP3_01076 [Sedimentisphaera cyanobacteriorum]|uniref:Alpha-galactosidase n=1 Tax=Sedimentisphaera cyanobacteriorum TaxID=1940790 RepID=A0A1Q2HPR2_9BACT|nr:hypothetical protein [Sedimentisphaera cyanobacteriorum]AQQ09274.1 hypothetical protein L21SP3_01076 [Sedimentisphaera cyanobacteriorum]
MKFKTALKSYASVTKAAAFAFLFIPAFSFAFIPPIDKSLGDARIYSDGERLTATTGKVQRVWQWTDYGLGTVSLKNLSTGKEWIEKPQTKCDWAYFAVTEDKKGVIRKLDAEVQQASPFTKKHLRLKAVIYYPSEKTSVLYEAYVYPGAEGIKTQLGIKRPPQSIAPIKTEKDKVIIKAENGSTHFPDDFRDQTDPAFATVLSSSSQIRFQIKNISYNRDYILGLSWWDWSGTGRRQRVVAKIGGDRSEAILIPTTTLPDYKNKQEKPDEFSIAIPGDMLLEEEFFIEIQKRQGPDAVISEIWMYEENCRKPMHRSELPVNRADVILGKAPEGFGLAAYMDCGERSLQRRSYNHSRGITENLNINFTGGRINFAGYNCINEDFLKKAPQPSLLKEETLNVKSDTSRQFDWANLMTFQSGENGIAVVKESNQCCNLDSFDTGWFSLTPSGLRVTGWGIRQFEMKADRFRKGWPTWTVLSKGDKDQLLLSLKKFDRKIFPQDSLGRFTYYRTGSRYNTSLEQNPVNSKTAAEKMALAGKAGFGIVNIDSGWELQKDKRLIGRDMWRPDSEFFPNGWEDVFKAMLENNLRTGLSAANSIETQDLLWNYERLKNSFWTLNNSKIRDYNELESFRQRSERYLRETEGYSCFSMETGKEYPSAGYYCLREYGKMRLYPYNSEHTRSGSQILKDCWELAKYNNPSKWLILLQDFGEYSPEFAAAASCSGLPGMKAQFFEKIEDKQAVSEVFEVYAENSEQLCNLFTFPIGESPSGESWAGFQFCSREAKEGFILIFREKENTYKNNTVKLLFLGSGKLKITNLLEKTEKITDCDDGFVGLRMDKPGDFLFLKYEKL